MFLLSSCEYQSNQKIRIGTNTWIGYEPLYVMQEFGLEPDIELEMLRATSASQILEKFAKGEIDLAALTLDEAMTLLDQGVKFHIVSVLDESDGADQVIGAEGINFITDIKGKNVGVEQTAVGQLLLNSLLKAASLTSDDIIIHNSAVNTHYDMFKRGEIDVAVTFSPFSNQLKTIAGTSAIYTSAEMDKGRIIDVLIASPKIVKEREKDLKKLVSAIYKGVELITEKDSRVIEFVGTNLSLPKSDWNNLDEGIKFTSKNMNTNYLHRYKLEATMIILNEVMMENGALNNDIIPLLSNDMFVRF